MNKSTDLQSNIPNDDQFLTRQETWEFLRVSRSQFDRMRKIPANNFPEPIYVFGNMFFSKQALLDWLAAQNPQAARRKDPELSEQLANVLRKERV